MNPAFRTFSWRVLPLHYDALAALIGEEDLASAPHRFGLQPFVKVQFTQHDDDPVSPFNADPRIGKCKGPTITPGPRPFLRDYYAWQATAGIRVEKDVAPTLPGDALGQSSQLWPISQTDFVSIAFTAAGRMAIAIDTGSGTTTIRRFIDDTGTQQASAPFLGKSSLLFFLGNLFVEETVGLAEIACIYLRPDDTSTIYCRFERDNFATEYPLNVDTPVNFGSLVSVSQNAMNEMVMLALDANGRDVVFTSQPYASRTDPTEETTAFALNHIGYITTAVDVTVPSPFDKSKCANSLSSITYIDTTVQPSGSSGVLTDKSASAYALTDIEYL